MKELDRHDEEEAFDKLRSKLERLAPANRMDDTVVVAVKLTILDLRALMQMYRRNC